jgi:hypothetical protein
LAYSPSFEMILPLYPNFVNPKPFQMLLIHKEILLSSLFLGMRMK